MLRYGSHLNGLKEGILTSQKYVTSPFSAHVLSQQLLDIIKIIICTSKAIMDLWLMRHNSITVYWYKSTV